MKRDIAIYIDGVKADVYDDISIALDFNSSLLADVSSIKCSGSKTIRLPKTETNDRIFDLPHLPSYESSKAHSVMSCSVYVDGITIISNGLCHLLASDGDHYEVAVTFGVMHSFEQWLKDKPKLTDLIRSGRGDSVPWNKTAGLTTWGSAAIFYARYNCIKEGDNSRYAINIHPSVTLAEVWRRVTEENNLDITFDGAYLDDMARKAIVLTKNKNTSLQTFEKTLAIQESPSYIEMGLENTDKKIYLNILDDNFFNAASSSFVYKGEMGVSITIGEIYLSLPVTSSTGDGASDFKSAALANPYDYALVIKPYNQSAIVVNPSGTLYDNTIVYRVNRTIEITDLQGAENQGKDILQIYAKITKWDTLPSIIWDTALNQYYGQPSFDYGGWTISLREALKFKRSNILSSIGYTYENNSNDYPLASFSLVENLPDITQVDFINFICKFYGLFPLQQGDKVVLIPFSRLFDNIDSGNIYDWSNALTEQYYDCPSNIAQTIDGYAQRNTIGYKQDSNDNVTDVAYLAVEDETIEREKKFIEFPFAASNGNRIPQYVIKDDNSVEKNECEYRIMTISKAAGEADNVATFSDDLRSLIIKNKHYASLQGVIRKPMQIEELMDLSLIELQALDYSRPVYLSKYGRFFAIISVQWQSDSRLSKVKLLRIR